MHEFRVHHEADEEGTSWWCEDGRGFVAVAGTLPQLKSLVDEWVEDEGIGEFELLMPNVQAEAAGL